jgi:ribosomal-protein-alanine N-acetyltransferase
MKLDANGKMIEFGDFPTLESKRLILRRMTMDDAEFFLRNFSDPTVVDLTAFEAPKDLEAAREELREYCIDNFTNNTGIRWGITIKGSQDLVGTCGFYKWAKQNYSAEIGYDLLDEHRRKGIMTEALTVMIDYLYGTLGLNRIQALIDPTNAASIKMIEGLGFKRDGVLREFTFFRGKFLDDVVYSLVAKDWV